MTSEVVSTLRAEFTADASNFMKTAAEVKAEERKIAQEAKQQARERMQQTKTLLDYNKRAAKEQADAARQVAKEQAQANKAMIDGLKKGAIAAAAFGVALKKAYDFGKEGAQLEFTKI